MSLPTPATLLDVVEATWPAASCSNVGPWKIRDGQNGGQRVAATTATGAVKPDSFELAEQAMSALNQNWLFMIRPGEDALDQELANRGYIIKDPVTVYSCPIETLLDQPLPPVSAFTVWPPLHIMHEIWESGGITTPRLAVMDRVQGPKTAILSRQSGHPAGAAFVAIHQKTAMIHAIEVSPTLRRKGAGINMMRAAAKWAQNTGADYFSLAVTDENSAANGLYVKLGMTKVAHYHYRIKQKT